MIGGIALALLAQVVTNATEEVASVADRSAVVAECASQDDRAVGFRLQLGIEDGQKHFVAIDPAKGLSFPYPKSVLFEDGVKFMRLPPVDTKRVFVMGWADPASDVSKGGKIIFTVENNEMGPIKLFDATDLGDSQFDCTFQGIATLSLQGVS